MLQLIKNLFIPHEGNDFHPHLLQKMAMGAMVFLVLLSFIGANIQALIWVNVDWLVGAVLPAVVVDKTNKERGEAALGALKRNPVLDIAAQMKADDMAKNSYFAHYSPAGVSPWHWFSEAKYNFLFAGENLAVHFDDSNQVVKAWMNSPTHRANIMNGVYTEIGIGVAKGKYEGYDTIFVVQLFGTPSLTKTEDKDIVIREVVENKELEIAQVPAKTDAVAGESALVVSKEPVKQEIPVEENKTVAVSFADLIPVAEEEAVIDSVEEKEESVVLASKTIATTSSSTLAGLIKEDYLAPAEITPAEKLLTSPLMVLQIIYFFVGAFVLIILAISLALEWKRHHPLQLVYSGGLLAVMIGLFYLHTLIVGAVTLA